MLSGAQPKDLSSPSSGRAVIGGRTFRSDVNRPRAGRLPACPECRGEGCAASPAACTPFVSAVAGILPRQWASEDAQSTSNSFHKFHF
jgi:hypothetical protein